MSGFPIFPFQEDVNDCTVERSVISCNSHHSPSQHVKGKIVGALTTPYPNWVCLFLGNPLLDGFKRKLKGKSP